MKKTTLVTIGAIVAIAVSVIGTSYAMGNSEHIDKAVEAGAITQEEADSLSSTQKKIRAFSQEKRLAEAVEEGTITQEEADEIKAWLDEKPEAMEKLGGFGLGMGHKGGHKAPPSEEE